MSYIIKAPNQKYTGISANVPFVDGIGQTDSDHLAEWFRKHDYTVEGENVQQKPISKMNKDELTAKAAELGADISTCKTNDEIKALLMAFKSDDED